MSLKNIAVETWTYKFGSGTGTVTVTNTPSQKVTFDGKKAFYGQIDISISNYVGGGIDQGSATASIFGSALHVNIEGKPAVLEGDKTMPIIIYGKSTVYPYNPSSTYDTVEVQKAGQTVAKGS